MKKRLVFVALVASLAVFTLVAAGTALAAAVQPAPATCMKGGGVPPGSVLIMNVTYAVTHDEQTQNADYHCWALANYVRHAQIWRETDGTTLYWVSQWAGTWTTPAGALSPGSGVVQPARGSGVFVAVLNGWFTSDTFFPAFGWLGTHDFGGTLADLLPNGQAGNPNPWSASDVYNDTVDWNTWYTVKEQYTYYYRHQTFSVSCYDNGPTDFAGDIVIK